MSVTPMAATWSEWTEWSNCTKCSNFEFSYRTRECKLPYTNQRVITSVKNECFGNNKELAKCKNCPENATNYFEWSAWSECSAYKCGNGTRTRWKKLQCSPSRDKLPCDGSEIVLERSACTANNVECVKSETEWSDWSNWSNCSASCGQGFTFRKRTCLKLACEGLSNEIKFCTSKIACTQESSTNEPHKPVLNETRFNSEWSEWSQWSPCNGGTVFKTRRCLSNGEIVPNYKCVGPSFISSECLNATHEKSNLHYLPN